MRKHSCRLDTSVGVSGPHDFAVRPKPPSSDAARASIASRLNVRDDREAPLLSEAGRGEVLKMICPMAQAECLRHIGTTGKSLRRSGSRASGYPKIHLSSRLVAKWIPRRECNQQTRKCCAQISAVSRTRRGYSVKRAFRDRFFAQRYSEFGRLSHAIPNDSCFLTKSLTKLGHGL
jgi:hypothetical protein